MSFEVKDLFGLSEPIVKLIEVVSSGVGTLYRPRSIRLEADAKAHEIKAVERAKVDAEMEQADRRFAAGLSRISHIADQYPELAQRAKMRLLSREIEGQINVEHIAAHAELALPQAVSAEPVSSDWRRKFFQEAENVCEADMQELWGKVLAGEIAQPGSFGLRTLETLKQLSRREAELFRRLCGLAMDHGTVVQPGIDINTDLKPFGFSYNEVLELRDASLLVSSDNLHNTYTSQSANPAERKIVLRNNGILIELSGAPTVSGLRLPCLIFTRAGCELQRLVEDTPNETYLKALGLSLRQRGVTVKRGTLVPQGEGVSLIVFERDL